MFRHKIIDNKAEKDSGELSDIKEDEKAASVEPMVGDVKKSEEVTPAHLKELLEKNLKWSQIIYEQNRRINGKLFWTAFSGWLRLVLILIPLLLALWYLPPIALNAWNKYGSLFGAVEKKGETSNSLESVLKMLNLTPTQEEKLKSVLR